MATTLIDSVIHWRKKLDKNLEEEIILNVIRKLSKIPITLEILQVTHIGKTIRKLSKRDDIVGEKALAVLKKWRDVFAKAEESVDRNSKSSSVSKKENVNKKHKSSSKYDISCEKTFHQNATSTHGHKHKHEPNSFSPRSSQQTELYVDRHHAEDTHIVAKETIIPSHSIYTYEKKETQAKYMDYDPHADVSEGYNPECPELFPGDNSRKIRKPDLIEDVELKLSQKRKLKTTDQTESLSKSRKFQSESHLNYDSVYTDESKTTQEKKEKHKAKDPKSHSSSIKTESGGKKAKSTGAHAEKHDLSPVTKKSKGKDKECNENNSAKCNKSKPKLKLNCSEEFTSSEVRFEDCLGFNDIVTLKKKKTPKSQPSTKKTSTMINNKIKSTTSRSPPDHHRSPVQEFKIPKNSSHSSSEKFHLKIPKPSSKLDVVDIVSTLPEIQPNYQPLPQRSLDFYSPKKKEVLTNEDAIKFMSSRKEKTAVYSGRRNCYFSEVPSLSDCCIRVLIENVDAIEYLGGVPYFLLKPILDRCTALQLFNIEHHNPHLLDSTNELWEIHCRRDYRLLSPQESETWRDLYLRAHDERERKLKSVTANISASMSKSNPVRQVKLAFVDSIAKPPRDVARRQAKNGTASHVNQTVKAGPSSKITPTLTAKPTAPAMSSAPIIPVNTSFAPKKPKVAPLMAKTLKSMKQCFRR